MALQTHQAIALGKGDEGLLLVLSGQAEADIHAAAGGGCRGGAVEAGVVDEVVECFRLLDVARLDGIQAALLDHPVSDQAVDVDREGGRGVEEALAVDVGGVAQHGGDVFAHALGQVLAEDDQGQAGRADVLLGAGEDEAELAHIDLAAEDVGGHIGHQGHIAGLGEVEVLGAVDGVVGADAEVCPILVDLPVLDALDLVVVDGGAVEDHLLGQSLDVQLLDGLVGPDAGVGVADGLAGNLQVHGHHGELEGGTALEEEHLVVLGNVQQLPEIRLRRLDDLVEGRRTVGLLDDAVATATVVGKFGLGLQNDGTGKRSGTCVEVKHLHVVFSFCCVRGAVLIRGSTPCRPTAFDFVYLSAGQYALI